MKKLIELKLLNLIIKFKQVFQTTSNTYELMHDVQNNQEGLSLRMTAMEYQLADINRELTTLVEFLRPNRILRNASLQHPESLLHMTVL